MITIEKETSKEIKKRRIQKYWKTSKRFTILLMAAWCVGVYYAIQKNEIYVLFNMIAMCLCLMSIKNIELKDQVMELENKTLK